MKKLVSAALVAMLSSGVAMASDSPDGAYAGPMYTVKVTNITKGVSFTPILGATHRRSIGLFEVGEAASQEVIDVAEGGAIGGLESVLNGLPKKVADTSSTGGLLGPGDSVEFEIDGQRGFNRFSLIAMLLPTNDTFVALNGVKLPRWDSATYYANAYDAGSEDNDELCANIPGPSCGGVGPSPESDGEGYVFPSQGIHGEGDLSVAAYDWRGPVAKVVVTRSW